MSNNLDNNQSARDQTTRFFITPLLSEKLKNLNETSKVEVLAKIAARILGAVILPLALLGDAAIQASLVLGKTATGIIVSPIVLIGELSTPDWQPSKTVKNLQISASVVRLCYTVQCVFSAAIIPFICLYSPSKAHDFIDKLRQVEDKVLRDYIEHTQKRITELENQLPKSYQSIIDTTELDRVKLELTQAKADNTTLNGQITQFTEQVTKIEEEKKQLTLANREENAKQIELLSNTIEDLNKKISEFKQEQEQNGKNQIDLQTKIREAEENNGKIKAESEQQRQQLKEVEHSLNNIKENNNVLKERINKQNLDFTNQNEELKNANNELIEKLREQQEKIKNLEEELKAQTFAKPSITLVQSSVTSQNTPSPEIEKVKLNTQLDQKKVITAKSFTFTMLYENGPFILSQLTDNQNYPINQTNVKSLVNFIKNEIEQEEELEDSEGFTNIDDNKENEKNIVIITQNTIADKETKFKIFENRINNSNPEITETFIACQEIFKPDRFKAEDFNKEGYVKQIIDRVSTYDLAQQKILNAADAINEIFAKSAIIDNDLTQINKYFDNCKNSLDNNPSLKKLFQIQIKDKDAAQTYETISKGKDSIIAREVLEKMRVYLGVKDKEKLNQVIELGQKIISNPKAYFDQGLKLTGPKKDQLEFTKDLTATSLKEIYTYLNSVLEGLDKENLTAKQLINLDAFSALGLQFYATNYSLIFDKDFDTNNITTIFEKIRKKINQKMADNSIKEELSTIQNQDINKNFYTNLKDKIEKTPDYPESFWFKPNLAEKMRTLDSLFPLISKKLGEPNSMLDEKCLVYQNDQLGYEVYQQPAQKEGEKPKLLFFFTRDGTISSKVTPAINHQLGLFGDSEIFKSAQAILSDLTSTSILEGYQKDLEEGKLEIVMSGFDNGGAAATVLASRMAILYPKVDVTAISAGSTTMVTTEEAYNMNQANNFFPIRLFGKGDNSVNRKAPELIGAFSNDTYNTFPLFIKHRQDILNVWNHNRLEYGNLDNFKPAMHAPILLHQLHQELTKSIKNKHQVKDTKVSNQMLNSIIGNLPKLTNFNNKLDDIVNYGQEIRSNLEKKNIKFGYNVIDLQRLNFYLKNTAMTEELTPGQLVDLVIGSNQLLIDSMKDQVTADTPQMIDLISQIRQEVINIIKKSKNGKEIDKLIIKNTILFNNFATEVQSLNKYYKDLFDEDILQKINFEDRFLEFLGFKIAVKDKPKIGAESYITSLYKDRKNLYDLSLYTPEDSKKKQRLVISCNGRDEFGEQALLAQGAGDKGIMDRARVLDKEISDQLDKLFKEHKFNVQDIDIVIIGHGTEGAVATQLGYQLAEKYSNSQVRSVGFGAPRFTTNNFIDGEKRKANFIPIRFLNPNDTTFELKLKVLNDHPLTEKTYYTIPIQFRNTSVSDLGKNHNTDLYGDSQNIKRGLRQAYQLREIAQGISNLTDTNQLQVIVDSSIAKRIKIDTQHAQLETFSKESVKDIKNAEAGKLIKTMKYCLELVEKENLSSEDKELIHTFFNHFIEAIKNEDTNEKHSIDNPFYQKMINHGYNPQQLFAGKWQLQRLISKELDQAMEAVEEAAKKEIEKSSKEKEELILRRNFYRGILGADLNGNRYKSAGGGVNGAVFFKHLEAGLKDKNVLLEGEESNLPFLGVFKPHPETVKATKGRLDFHQAVERAKSVVGMDAQLNSKDEDKRVHNEVFAYELFHLFGFNQVIGFPTTIQVINKNDPRQEKRPASFCAFMPGLDPVSEHIGTPDTKDNHLNDAKKEYTDEERHLWEMSKLFDFLTGNLDGHEGNAFVEIKNGKLTRAINFDYDKAFAVNEPNNIGNQYKWTKLAISDHPFTLQTKEALKAMLKDEHKENKIKQFLKLAHKNSENNFTKKQENLLRKRIGVLEKIATGKIKKLSDLKKYKKYKKIEKKK